MPAGAACPVRRRRGPPSCRAVDCQQVLDHGAHAPTTASRSRVAFDDGTSPGSAPCRRMPCWMSSGETSRTSGAVFDREGGGDADGLAHGHAGRDLAGHLLRFRGGGVVPAGDQELVHFLGQQRAVRVVVVAAAGHGVGEVPAGGDVVLGHDVLALEQAGLPDAHLGGDVQHVAVLEAGQVGADVVHGLGDPVAGGELGGGHVRRVDAVEAGHVRGVAPDDAVDGGLEPPQFPGAAEEALDLAVDGAGFLRVGLLERFGGVGVDVAEAEDEGGEVAVLDVAGAGPGGDVDVAGGVDDDVRHKRLRAGLGLADDALHHAVVHDGAGEPGVQAEVDAGFADEVVGDALPAVRVERRGVADRLRGGVGVEVEGAVAAPLVPEFLGGLAVIGRRHDGQAQLLQPFDVLGDDAGDGDFLAVDHVIEHQDHTAGGEAAERGVAFQQRDGGAGAGGRDGGGDTGGAAAHHQDVGAGDDGGGEVRRRGAEVQGDLGVKGVHGRDP